MRNDEILEILRKSGENGISAQDLAKKFKFARVNSICKPINQLRLRGHNIANDRNLGVYILYENDNNSHESQLKVDPITEPINGTADITESDAPSDAKFLKMAGKREKVLEYLIRSGENGAKPIELSKYSGVSVKNICFHIHDLRKSGNHIKLIEGRYCIQAGKKYPRYNKGTKDLPLTNDTADIELILGDKRLLKGIKKIQPADLPTYMDLLKKIIYYTNCALAMHNTIDMLESLTIGDDQ